MEQEMGPFDDEPVVLHCSKCWGARDTTGRYCRACRTRYMREDYRPRVKQFAAGVIKLLSTFSKKD